MRSKLLSIILLPLAIVGCLSGAEKGKAPKDKNKNTVGEKSTGNESVTEPRVQEIWQKNFYDILSKEAAPSTQAWALFSYGGWADQGQIMIFVDRNKSAKTFLVDTGSKTVNDKKDFSEKTFQNFIKSLDEFSSLKDYESNVMDGVQWEYVLAHIDENSVPHFQKRVFMNNPGVNEQGKNHAKLVQQFLELRTKLQAN